MGGRVPTHYSQGESADLGEGFSLQSFLHWFSVDLASTQPASKRRWGCHYPSQWWLTFLSETVRQLPGQRGSLPIVIIGEHGSV